MRLAAVLVALTCVAVASAADSTVKVHLLDHTKKPPGEKKFWIDWSNQWRGIVESKTITGDEAERLIAVLHGGLQNTEAGHFCGHDPIYGIEATDKNGRVLKTSLCFTCLTWVKPGLRLDIAGKPGPDNELCLALRKVIELPEDLRKPAEKK